MIFEIIDNDFKFQIKPEKLLFPNSKLDWDRNWISAKIFIKTGGFIGNYIAEIMTLDFEKFKQELIKLYDNLNGSANFECLEHYLTIKIKGDGLGHFTAYCEAIDKPSDDENKLSFSFYFDQTQIKDLVNQLDLITKEYPITGDFKIKNE